MKLFFNFEGNLNDPIKIHTFYHLDWFDLTYKDEGQGRIKLVIKFTSKESLEEETEREVKDAYFPLRENNRFILYQDAETTQIPQVDYHLNRHF